MSNRNKCKGSRIEREIVARHHAAGIPAERVPLSGALGGSLDGDVRVFLGKPGHFNSLTLKGEVKARKDGAGFKTLERWLGTMSILFLRRNHKAPLVVLPWSTYVRLAQHTHDVLLDVMNEPCAQEERSDG